MNKKPTKWIQKANMKAGAFEAQAKRVGMDTQAFATKVLANPKRYRSTTVLRARAAKTFKNMADGRKK